MRKAITFSLALIGWMLLSAPLALGCDCNPPPGVVQSLEKAKAVFVGKVISVKKTDKNCPALCQVNVLFEVEESWKGVDEKRVVVSTGHGFGDCGVGFKRGRRYLVYAGGAVATRYSASVCSRTRSLAHEQARQDLKELGAGKRLREARRR